MYFECWEADDGVFLFLLFYDISSCFFHFVKTCRANAKFIVVVVEKRLQMFCCDLPFFVTLFTV